jgi:protein-disulfide isomerase
MRQKEQLLVIPSKEIILGNRKAPIQIELFGDYESEATGRADAVVREQVLQQEEEMGYTFRHFPLTRVHQKAHKAAEAAIGAAQEGRFWEMHELLFHHRLTLGVISLKSYAREAGVKDKKFLDHLINSDWGWYVQDDLREGLQRGVVEIPALFINGVRFTKEITTRNVKAHLETLLREAPVAGRKRA